jgi:NitT/TauT family transport system ATP-binding protein
MLERAPGGTSEAIAAPTDAAAESGDATGLPLADLPASSRGSEGASDWILRAEQLHYSYATGTEAVRGIDLELARGRVLGIVGPSGCGKSTLLSILAGLRKASSGEVRWGSPPQSSRRHERRVLTYMFQQDTLLPWLSVAKNVALGLRYLQLPRSTKTERVDQLLSMGGLAQFRDAHPYQLSGGMRRRVAFLAAVAPYPEALLLDEPFVSVDEPTRVAIHQDILAIIYKLKMSVLLVTHDLGEAISLADEVYILTARPARVAARYEIPFGRDRDVLALRETPLYQELYRSLWHDLAAEIRRAGDST